MASTTLSNLITRMDRYQSLAAIDEVYKVNDIDEAIRDMKRSHNLPFLQRKTTLRVFPDVFLYPVVADHDYLIFLDTNDATVNYGERMRMRYTSLQQFYEDLDYRNTVAEIWDGNTLTIGVRDKSVPPGFLSGSQLVDSAESVSDYTAEVDASALTLDTVLFTGDSSSSVRFTNTNSTNVARVSWSFDAITDANYQRKYFFLWVYLSAAPTSITLRFGADSLNYLSAAQTTQFSGQAFKANDWNLVAMDLNTATATGTISTSTSFDYAAVQLNSAATGSYNIDASYLRGWALLDYWYVSKYIVATSNTATPTKESFISQSLGTYTTSDVLIGDYEWADLVMYRAMQRSLADKENDSLKADVEKWLEEANSKLAAIYPDPKPLQITQKYRFNTDFSDQGYLSG